MADETYLSRQQVADKLGISGHTWDSIVAEGVTPAYVLVANRPRLKRWRATEIDAWMAEYGKPVGREETLNENGEDSGVEHGADNPIVD